MDPQVNDAFVQELNQHLGIARKISRVYFHNPDDRQDAMQEMMYQLWRSYPRFDGRSKFSTWMYRVCLNTALTYKKKSAERNEPLSRVHGQIPDEQGPVHTSTEQLITAIGELSPLNRAIIMLYLDSMSYDEIAAITGLTKSNVSVRLVRIKRELEILLKK
ncbi:MAG TPA: sigma-70 family RNA polymerase sigma factor [Cyclobacteriaceae bacterium]|nr:sigma-70 family RNA polymerase sigma factor [Cyclobacteriaceae bacterium]